jgi:hypothetical protein
VDSWPCNDQVADDPNVHERQDVSDPARRTRPRDSTLGARIAPVAAIATTLRNQLESKRQRFLPPQGPTTIAFAELCLSKPSNQ